MRCEQSDKKPTWGQLYAIGLLLVGLIGLVEALAPGGGLRAVLEIAVVIVMFGLMAVWMRANRVALERRR